jgi:hypothetical protein
MKRSRTLEGRGHMGRPRHTTKDRRDHLPCRAEKRAFDRVWRLAVLPPSESFSVSSVRSDQAKTDGSLFRSGVPLTTSRNSTRFFCLLLVAILSRAALSLPARQRWPSRRFGCLVGIPVYCCPGILGRCLCLSCFETYSQLRIACRFSSCPSLGQFRVSLASSNFRLLANPPYPLASTVASPFADTSLNTSPSVF